MFERVSIFYPKSKYNTSSFAIAGRNLAYGFKKLGAEVSEKDIFTELSDAGDINIFIPWHYRVAFSDDYLRDTSILALIADNDKFSEDMVSRLESGSYGMAWAPSRFVEKVFGVPKMACIPYPYSPGFKVGKKEKNDEPVVLISSAMLWHRRGLDISIKALDALYSEGYKFKAILSIYDTNEFASQKSRPWLSIRGGFKTQTEYNKLYRDSDIFLHPARGGAFEIPIVEALVAGLTTVIPARSPYADIPMSSSDVYFIGGEYKRVQGWSNKWHTGMMWEVSVDDTIEAMKKAFKHSLHIDTKEYKKRYSSEHIAMEMMDEYVELQNKAK